MAHLQSISSTQLNLSRLRPTALATASGYDRAAIMRRAVQIARSLRLSSLTWSAKMRIGLTTAWKSAREERAAAQAVATRPAPALSPREAIRPAARPVRTWTSGSHRFSHGW